MPYLKQTDRAKLDKYIERLAVMVHPNARAGELNYIINKLAMYLFLKPGFKYKDANELMGAIEAAKLELYRKVIGPYEDEKERDNGSVHFDD